MINAIMQTNYKVFVKDERDMNITVYLGASEGNDQNLKKAVRELGTWIGTSGNDRDKRYVR